jgi:hypothetical protein
MEIAAPLMDRLFAILALEATGGLFASLLLRSRVLRAAWTAKVDGYSGANAHLHNMRPKWLCFYYRPPLLACIDLSPPIAPRCHVSTLREAANGRPVP